MKALKLFAIIAVALIVIYKVVASIMPEWIIVGIDVRWPWR